jgi:signal transduction histidine kinase
VSGTSPVPMNLHVEIDSNVVWQLGAELITDAEQALLELIKNSYDADARVARVVIDTDDSCDGVQSTRRLKGSIVVDDDGTGMDLEAIEHGWLTISLSLKRGLKERGKKTDLFHRTPLGDKGLGRLGTMKLGDTVDIVTHYSKSEPGYRVRLSWAKFLPGTPLSRVPVEIDRVRATGRTGTRLTVFGLHEPQYWRGRARHDHLVESLSTLISPFQRFANFRISIEADGDALQLHELGDDLRKAATARFSFEWTGQRLKCEAHFKLALFKGSTDGDEFERLLTSDRGDRFAKFLKTDTKMRGTVRAEVKGPSFLSVSDVFGTEDFLSGDIEDPGPFDGEIDAFELDSDDGSNVFSTASEYRQYIKRFAGVSVYRDHFAIRMEEDWLRLGQSWTSGKSYYGLKPANTIGYFELSAAENPALQEKSDREGFLDSRPSRGFFAITRQCVAFANTALTDARRAFLRFRDREKASEAKLTSAWVPPDAVGALRDARHAAARAQQTIASTERQRKAALFKVRDSLKQLVEDGELPSSQLRAAKEAARQLDDVVNQWDRQRSLLENQLAALKEDESLTSVLLERFEHFKRQLSDVYEAVGLGLVAEGLAHEMHGILEDLVQRTNRVMPRAKRSGEPTLVGYLEAVRATVNTLRKQVSFLDPMLRTTREQRSVFAISDFVRDFAELRGERFDQLGIRLEVDVTRDFTVRMSRGRLQQVLDNLVRNSEFWLRQQSASGGGSGRVRFEIASPLVTVEDSGPGVKPSIEGALFEPFVSGKPGGKGRGLGLFISRQLLQRDGCDLVLEPDRNAKGRKYRFSIDLRTVEQSDGSNR